MLKTKENKVTIEGIVSEVDFRDGSFMRDGSPINSFGGTVKVRVTQKINGVDTELEIPVHAFAAQRKRDGNANPIYESLKKYVEDTKSAAVVGLEEADRVRITGATIDMNEYYGQNGQLITFPRISSSFFRKINKNECNPEATFSVIMTIGKAAEEVDREGVPTGRYKIQGIIPRYNGEIDIIPFIADNPGVIDTVSQCWNEGDTVKATGKLNFTSKTVTETVEQDFGEPLTKTRTISVSELVINGGLSTPLDGELAYDINEVKEAIAARTVRLEQLKAKQEARASKPKTTPSSSINAHALDLGF